jgi:hypothetical protein
MTAIEQLAAKTPVIGFEEVKVIQRFFEKGALLSRACKETGLDVQAVRRNLKGDSKNVRLMYAVILGEWLRMWRRQEEQRKAIAEQVGK